MDAETARDAYYGSMLFYLGCTADAEISAELFDEGVLLTHFIPVIFGKPQETVRGIVRALGDQGARRLVRAAQGVGRFPGAARGHKRHIAAMCEVAQLLCDRLGVPSSVRGLFTDLPERWDGQRPGRRPGEQVPMAIRIAQVARDAAFQSLVGGVDHARETVRARSGHAFDPAVADVLVAEAAEILPVDDGAPAWDQALAAEPGTAMTLHGEQVDDALSAMADFADLVSPHLAGHSQGVGRLAGLAAEQCGLTAAEVVDVRRAGLVHDLGRVAVHAGVWARPQALNQDQWEQVRLHAYHSERVLGRSRSSRRCASRARGTTNGWMGPATTAGRRQAPCRLRRGCWRQRTAYHAMTEPRAHRPPLAAQQAADLLGDQARSGRLDAAAVDAVLGAAGHPSARPALPAGLTPREAEVIGLIARGLQTKQVARVLTISPKTADRHVQNAYAKIGVSSRAAAAVFAMQHGLVPWGEHPMSRTTEPS